MLKMAALDKNSLWHEVTVTETQQQNLFDDGNSFSSKSLSSKEITWKRI